MSDKRRPRGRSRGPVGPYVHKDCPFNSTTQKKDYYRWYWKKVTKPKQRKLSDSLKQLNTLDRVSG